MNTIKTFTMQFRAVQWTGSDESWDAICELYNSIPKPNSYYCQQEDDTILIALRYADARIMRVGQWLALDALNIFHIYDDNSFSVLTKLNKIIE